jgi:hypothetical protein
MDGVVLGMGKEAVMDVWWCVQVVSDASDIVFEREEG